MTSLIGAEFRKLFTTRTLYYVLAGVLAMAVVSVIDPEHTAASFERPFHEHTFLFFTSLLARVLILVLGIRAIADEYRHGTIVPTFLVTPERGRVFVAKTVAVASVGAILAVLTWAAMVAAASALAHADGTTLTLGQGAWRSLAGTTAAGAAWGVIGLGLGAAVRSQLVATVGGIVWLMGIEDAVRGWLGDLAVYLPGQAGLSLALAPASRALLVGALALGAYAALAALAGAWAVRRDVT